jgi:hypothetical protein
MENKVKEKEAVDNLNKMVCPECSRTGRKSLIYDHGCAVLVPAMVFWDENGESHYHSAVHRMLFRCTNNHILYRRTDASITANCSTCSKEKMAKNKLIGDGYDGWMQTENKTNFWLELVEIDEPLEKPRHEHI